MTKLATLAALTMAGLALAAPTASAATSVASQPDALDGLSSGLNLSPPTWRCTRPASCR
ncbi:hypothetical protein ACFQ0M_26770 [Kitasatospora aburaviensis]